MRHPRLVLAAHGSTDSRFAATVDAVADGVRELRPELDVAVGYLEHGPPDISDVSSTDSVIVPLLLASGFHVRTDLPAQAPDARIAAALGPDRRLALALADRLVEAGYDGRSPVTLAAAGSSDETALAEVVLMASWLAERLGVPVTTAFVSVGTPRLSDMAPGVVASYLLAPGAFHDALSATGASLVSAPIGAHPVVAEVVLDRYDAQVPGRTAPA